MQLQDEFGCDVNLLLFACWYGSFFGAIDPALQERCVAWSRNWQAAVVAPMRSVRRWLKKPDDRTDSPATGLALLRSRIKEQELASEKIHLDYLQESAYAFGKQGKEKISSTATAITNNLHSLVAGTRATQSEIRERHLQTIINAAMALSTNTFQDSPESASDG